MPETLGDRIEDALERAEMSVKELENALEEEGVVGGSYANLHRLKSDKFDRPSANLLYGIARATGADLTWLVSGDVPPTPETEAERLATEGADTLEDALDGVAEGFGDGAETVLRGRESPLGHRLGTAGLRRALLSHTWRRLAFTRRAQPYQLDGTLSRRIGSALAGPLEAMGVDLDDLPDDSLTDYVDAMTTALRAVCPEPPEPTPSIRQEGADGD